MFVNGNTIYYVIMNRVGIQFTFNTDNSKVGA